MSSFSRIERKGRKAFFADFANFARDKSAAQSASVPYYYGWSKKKRQGSSWSPAASLALISLLRLLAPDDRGGGRVEVQDVEHIDVDVVDILNM